MAAHGVAEADIARVLAIDPKTLRKHYRDELDTGHIKANSKIAESLYRKALGDGAQSVTAAIFWLKTRARWKETVVQEAEVRHSYVVRTPPPAASVAEWLRRYAPPEIEHNTRLLPGRYDGG
jgi:hypothetical protein